jgi:hypothetical protein
MTYFLYIDAAYAVEAESEDDAKEEARAYFIEQLQRGNLEILIEEE